MVEALAPTPPPQEHIPAAYVKAPERFIPRFVETSYKPARLLPVSNKGEYMVKFMVVSHTQDGKRSIGIGALYRPRIAEAGTYTDFDYVLPGYDDIETARAAVQLADNLTQVDADLLEDCYRVIKPASRSDYLNRIKKLRPVLELETPVEERIRQLRPKHYPTK